MVMERKSEKLRNLKECEVFDYLSPRLKEFYRYRILFYDEILRKFSYDYEKADQYIVNLSEVDLRLLYVEFYNKAKSRENLIKLEDVKFNEENSFQEISLFFEKAIEDEKNHRDSIKVTYFGNNDTYEYIINNWVKELML